MGTDETYDLGLLAQSDRKWRASSGLRFVYGRIYARMKRVMADGPSLELGSGIGNGKEFIPDLVTSDLETTDYVDRAVDAYAIPEEPGGWGNILGLDVLHHLRFPMVFLQSSANALRAGGRIVLTEPAATPLGILFYRAFHPEPIKLAEIQPPFAFPREANGEEAFANMAMGVGMFERFRHPIGQQLANLGLEIVQVAYSDTFAYPLTGGYSKPQLMPTPILKALAGIEDILPGAFFRWIGLRMIIVIEKSHDPQS